MLMLLKFVTAATLLNFVLLAVHLRFFATPLEKAGVLQQPRNFISRTSSRKGGIPQEVNGKKNGDENKHQREESEEEAKENNSDEDPSVYTSVERKFLSKPGSPLFSGAIMSPLVQHVLPEAVALGKFPLSTTKRTPPPIAADTPPSADKLRRMAEVATKLPPGKVHIITGVDNFYGPTKYSDHMASMLCFARKWGYNYHVIQVFGGDDTPKPDLGFLTEQNHNAVNPDGSIPSEAFALKGEEAADCAQYKMPNFHWHCVMKYWLEKRMLSQQGRFDGDEVIVFSDADIMIGAMDRNLDYWLADMVTSQEHVAADFLMFRRCWCSEVMAGSWMLRMNDLAIDFFDYWANYEKVQNPHRPSDNPALQLVLSDWVEGSRDSDNAVEARRRYYASDDKMNLSTYFETVTDYIEKQVVPSGKLLELRRPGSGSVPMSRNVEFSRSLAISGLGGDMMKLLIYPRSSSWSHDWRCGRPDEKGRDVWDARKTKAGFPVWLHGVKCEEVDMETGELRRCRRLREFWSKPKKCESTKRVKWG